MNKHNMQQEYQEQTQGQCQVRLRLPTLPTEVLFQIWSFMPFKQLQDCKIYALNRVYCEALYGLCIWRYFDCSPFIGSQPVNRLNYLHQLLTMINENKHYALQCVLQFINKYTCEMFNYNICIMCNGRRGEQHHIIQFLYEYSCELNKCFQCNKILYDAFVVYKKKKTERFNRIYYSGYVTEEKQDEQDIQIILLNILINQHTFHLFHLMREWFAHSYIAFDEHQYRHLISKYKNFK